MQKQNATNPKPKNTTYLRKQKYKSQNRNKHPKAETRTKKVQNFPTKLKDNLKIQTMIKNPKTETRK